MIRIWQQATTRLALDSKTSGRGFESSRSSEGCIFITRNSLLVHVFANIKRASLSPTLRSKKSSPASWSGMTAPKVQHSPCRRGRGSPGTSHVKLYFDGPHGLVVSGLECQLNVLQREPMGDHVLQRGLARRQQIDGELVVVAAVEDAIA